MTGKTGQGNLTRINMTREEKIKLYTKLVDSFHTIELKGNTIPYTSLNGHMFSYLTKEDVLALRLPEEAIDEFLKKHKTTLVTSYGIVQKNYVAVPDALLKKTGELKKYFDISYKHISLLRPKPTTRKKKS